MPGSHHDQGQPEYYDNGLEDDEALSGVLAPDG